jgi:hypothetical protein
MVPDSMLAVNPWTRQGVIHTQVFEARERGCRERVRSSVTVTLEFRPCEMRAGFRLLDVVLHRRFV